MALTTGAQLDRVLALHRTGGIDHGGTALTMEAQLDALTMEAQLDALTMEAQLDRVLLTTEARH